MKIDDIINGDCLEVMKGITDKSIDMILCDLPYGTTACGWDIVMDFDLLWTQYKRIVKDNTCICLFGSQPFTTDLIMSNRKWFRYEWVWNKETGSNFQTTNKIPMKYHENILIFYKKQCKYNPIMVKRKKIKDYRNSKNEIKENIIYNSMKDLTKKLRINLFPKSIITINSQIKECNNINRLHPTQKPVKLFEYLIKTYTDENDIILDNCIGSGTTAVACIKTGRRYIGIEKEKKYCDIANKRIEKAKESISLLTVIENDDMDVTLI